MKHFVRGLDAFAVGLVGALGHSVAFKDFQRQLAASAFTRDALDLGEWRVVALSLVLYGGFIVLLLGRRLSYKVRAVGFLMLLYVVGLISLLTVGYLSAPTSKGLMSEALQSIDRTPCAVVAVIRVSGLNAIPFTTCHHGKTLNQTRVSHRKAPDA